MKSFPLRIDKSLVAVFVFIIGFVGVLGLSLAFVAIRRPEQTVEGAIGAAFLWGISTLFAINIASGLRACRQLRVAQLTERELVVEGADGVRVVIPWAKMEIEPVPVELTQCGGIRVSGGSREVYLPAYLVNSRAVIEEIESHLSRRVND